MASSMISKGSNERSSLAGAGQQILGLKSNVISNNQNNNQDQFADRTPQYQKHQVADDISDDDLDDMGDDPMMHAEPTFGSNNNAH